MERVRHATCQTESDMFSQRGWLSAGFGSGADRDVFPGRMRFLTMLIDPRPAVPVAVAAQSHDA
jgi:hypothetical protein